MKGKDFNQVVELVLKDDSRFGKGAYYFVRKALDYTVNDLKGDEDRASHHVSGQELLEGIRKFALEQYGPLALAVLNNWNIRKCSDFGDIVFNLVEFGVLGTTEQDQREDFLQGYDFNEAFLQPFQPTSRRIPPFKGKIVENRGVEGLS